MNNHRLNGFRSLAEMRDMIGRIQFNTNEQLEEFRQWFQHDGTREKLLGMIGRNYNGENRRIKTEWKNIEVSELRTRLLRD